MESLIKINIILLKPKLIGYAADGFHIYSGGSVKSSYKLKNNTRKSGPGGRYDGTFIEDYEYVKDVGELDKCNGKFVSTNNKNNPSYHYDLTKEFPYIPRYFRGTPDNSFF